MSIEFQERAIDRHFADFLCRHCNQLTEEAGKIFRLVASLVSNTLATGNICLNLHDIAGRTINLHGNEFTLPNFAELYELLKSADVVTAPGQHLRPLVLDSEGRLYLYRYWRYEHDLAQRLLQKASATRDPVDDADANNAVARLFPASVDERQRQAATVALHRHLCVISGGPGTGKTSTVVRILALLLELDGCTTQRIAMAAPTGKAAARLKQSVNDIRQTLNCSDAVKAAIPDDVVTIQRLLGSISGSTRYRHSLRNPLPFDTVIIDEASMVALPLMSALVEALKPAARLILLGDKDQLSSVEAGAVLGDICGAAEEGSAASPLPNSLSSSLVVLEKNYRFQQGSGIADISYAVNAGLDREALKLLKNHTAGTLLWHRTPTPDMLRSELASKVVDGYQRYLQAQTPAEALKYFDRFRILCALREGVYGVTGLNTMIEQILARAGLIAPSSTIYAGRPILVTVNNYTMRLFNGDTGILFHDPDHNGELRACFPTPDGSVRTIPPERLPAHETAYAMTIHKSQGSEFERVLMLLPPVQSDLLTRELIYTGITRAKKSVEIWADEALFCASVQKKTARHSGLQHALRWNQA